ncbi:hypothetical protein SLEP1_g22715 [Rubroshorea leprosula]|uniref:Prenyltransferase alpha-alpha toroid domain-containing protein n=1 Tax=Rubroshorea leprosula TaxID=152421 RepID=A0AAV5JKG3_9ROSI|nr:hypothetical protein SLEP1_g22715 [Rubroshorea leprosula]
MGELAVDKHVQYIISVEKRKDSFESVVMEHLRMNGAYWGLTTLDLLGRLNAVNANEVLSWIMKCQHESSGFAGNVGHDPHILYTLSAVQVLALFDKLDVLDIEKVANCILWLSAFLHVWPEISSVLALRNSSFGEVILIPISPNVQIAPKIITLKQITTQKKY